MPANLTPTYHAADKKFKQARTSQDKIAALEEMLRVIPKHKGTDHMQADLRKRLKKVREEAKSKKGPKKTSLSHYVEQEGIGQIFLVGPPNSGKSAILDVCTGASPEVADYPYTTRIYQPGMMRYEDVWIQLVDMPPISLEHTEAWLPSVVRYGHAIVLVLDGSDDDLLDHAPMVIDYLLENKVQLAQRNEETGQFDTGIASLKTIVALSHGLDQGLGDRRALLEEMWDGGYPIVELDIYDEQSLRGFALEVYRMLGKVRVYAKQRNKPPDMDDPFVLNQGATVRDLARKIHKDIAKGLSFARVWGEGKYDGQRVNRDYILEERDVIELHF
jgi:uncharacterized protein